jgi:hypothetical protein
MTLTVSDFSYLNAIFTFVMVFSITKNGHMYRAVAFLTELRQKFPNLH